jgi:hypothetical protein
MKADLLWNTCIVGVLLVTGVACVSVASFEALDANRDGVLTSTEFDARLANPAILERYDSDKDGVVSRKEYDFPPPIGSSYTGGGGGGAAGGGGM